MIRNFFIIRFLLTCFTGCMITLPLLSQDKLHSSMETISKPYTRYWWFASEIKKEDIRYNLDWMKQNGFGGVEIAWVYPLNSMDKQPDSTYTPRQKWLSPEWQEIVGYAIMYADSIGMACDLTLGTLWPFGDSYVTYDQAAQVYGDEKRQVISRSWEYPRKGYVVDHLDSNDYIPYFRRMLDSFPRPHTRIPQSYFIDSWEVETKKIWTDGFGKEFKGIYGYDITPFMESIYNPDNSDFLYDYMKLISKKVIDFYRNYDKILNEKGILSRGQCSGAPCDILTAYALMDIPEGEVLLYEPEYNSIPASAALLSGKNVVSAETFTCLYGWPRHYIREEQSADLKMVADALFASGVNHIIWHGKPHNPSGMDTVSFYASVHIGPEGTLATQIADFNHYLAIVSETMKKGVSYSDVAVYLPLEDAWMKGIMPKEKQFIWAWGFYEMRYVCFPEEVAGHHPVWINKEFLSEATLHNNLLTVGDAGFNSLYVDAEYLDYETLLRIRYLALKGFPVFLKQIPLEPGTVKHDDYAAIAEELTELPNVTREFIPVEKPLVEGEIIPPYHAREHGDTLYLFFAGPQCKQITFPVEYGQSFSDETVETDVVLNYQNKRYEVTLRFQPYKSLLYKIRNGKVEQIKLSFIPHIPVVKKRPGDFREPWLPE